MSTKARDLPPVETLSQRQLRGADCVFCGVTLAPGNVVDLEEQDEGGSTWSPRAHPRHFEVEPS